MLAFKDDDLLYYSHLYSRIRKDVIGLPWEHLNIAWRSPQFLVLTYLMLGGLLEASDVYPSHQEEMKNLSSLLLPVSGDLFVHVPAVSKRLP